MIIGRVKNQTLEIEQPVIAADTIDYLTALFTFSPDWNGLTKWAHFAKGEIVYDIELVNDGIAKDRHLSLSVGSWSVYLHGNEIIGGVVTERITTQVKSLTVEASGVLNGEPLPVTPPSVGEQILAVAQNALSVANGVRADADAGEFDGVPAGFGDPVITAETLTPGSPATASIVASGPDTAKIFTIAIGIPEGDKGDTGDKGDKGDKGDTGATGPQGERGYSAYEQAVTGGYTDTEAAFLADLAAIEGLAAELEALL